MSEGFSHLPSLEDVSTTCSSCFHKLEILEHISLLPCFVGRLAQGVCQHLNKKLLRYSDNYQGVLLAYSKPCVQQSHGRILDEQPHIHFDLKYTAYVFRPVIGSLVCGTVNNVGEDHVGCLVYECFNASVFWQNREEKEKRKKNGLFTTKFELGSKIWFRVLSIENISGILSIVGEYFDLSKFSEGGPESENYNEDGDSALEMDVSLTEVTEVDSDKQRIVSGDTERKKRKTKSSKKKKRDEESMTDLSQVESEVEHSADKARSKKHKKKSKSSKVAFEEVAREKKIQNKRKLSSSLSETPKKKKRKLVTDDISSEIISTSKKQRKHKR